MNISTKTLIPSKYNPTYQKISTKSLSLSTNNEFDSHILLDVIKYKQQRLKNFNDEIYKQCCDLIIESNNKEIYDIFFVVPNFSLSCPEYDSNNCILYIMHKLQEQSLLCKQISKTKIFISWYNIEQMLSEQIDDDNNKDSY